MKFEYKMLQGALEVEDLNRLSLEEGWELVSVFTQLKPIYTSTPGVSAGSYMNPSHVISTITSHIDHVARQIEFIEIYVFKKPYIVSELK